MLRWKRIRAWAPRIRDGLVVAIILTESVTNLFTEQYTGWAPRWVSTGIGAALAVAFLWRRRFPIRLALAAAIAYPIVNMASPLLFGLYGLAFRRRDRVLLLVGLAAYAGFLAVELPNEMRKPDREEAVQQGEPGTQQNPIAVVTFGALLIGAPVGLGAYFGVRHDLLGSLRERAERAEAERELRAEQARLSERARIAQEMHDVLAHKVSLIALHAGGMEVNPAMGAAKVEGSASLIRETARQAMEDLREVLGVLRTDTSAGGADLAPMPTAADLERLVAASRDAGVAVTAEIVLPENIPDSLGRTVYRIVQEALTNVHKHARGAATTVRVVASPGDGVNLRVENARPVASGSLLPGSGAGLVGLRERVKLAEGTLTAGPTVDGGWQLDAWLPWADDQ